MRFGSFEIYNILSTPTFAPFILDALVVGQQRVSPPYADTTEQVLLFIKCAAKASSGTLIPRIELEDRIRERISNDLSRRHVPRYIFEVDQVPYNANGKKLEIQVKTVVCGGDPAMSRLKLSPQEFIVLDKYVRFYHVEKLVGKSATTPAKL